MSKEWTVEDIAEFDAEISKELGIGLIFCEFGSIQLIKIKLILSMVVKIPKSSTLGTRAYEKVKNGKSKN